MDIYKTFKHPEMETNGGNLGRGYLFGLPMKDGGKKMVGVTSGIEITHLSFILLVFLTHLIVLSFILTVWIQLFYQWYCKNILCRGIFDSHD